MSDISYKITMLLHGLGISSKLKGFGYLYDIIYYVIENLLKNHGIMEV